MRPTEGKVMSIVFYKQAFSGHTEFFEYVSEVCINWRIIGGMF